MNRFALASARLAARALGTRCVLTLPGGVTVDCRGVHAPSEEIVDRETGDVIRREETLTIPEADLPSIPAPNSPILVGEQALYVLRAVERGPVVVIDLTKRRIQ